jgi:hypothetical protein
MRRSVLATVILLIVAACGDDGTGDTTILFGTTSATTTAAPTTVATTVAPTTSATTTAPPTTAATTTAPTVAVHPETVAPTAADTLFDFFDAAVRLDLAVGDAAALFNAQWDAGAGTLGAGAREAIDGLSAGSLEPLIPAGLSPALEIAVLAVFTDLDSRIAALDGGARFAGDEEFARICLGYGGESAARFDEDLDRAWVLAHSEPPPTAAPDSDAAGMLAVQIALIGQGDWGCDACGGANYTGPLEVDWAGRTILGNVEFEATYNGTSWEITIYAC